MIRVVQFSGGKDSTALVLWAREQWGDGFTPVFCDTGWEHFLTYGYVQQINQDVLGGRLVTVRSTKYPGGMRELVVRRKIVPLPRMRFCTEELKVFPFVEWMRANVDDEATVYQGIRADESHARSTMPRRVWEPLYEAWIERPLFDWTAEQCFALHAKHGIEPNPLYKLGSARVGCFPCVMTNKAELKRLTELAPEVWDRAAEIEGLVEQGRSFFRCDFIPERFQTGRYSYVEDGIEKTGSHPTVADVRRYVTSADDQQLRMWDRCTPSGCLSVYNLCE